MRPKFSREGRVAGYLGQCPKYDQIFIFIASLSITIESDLSELVYQSRDTSSD